MPYRLLHIADPHFSRCHFHHVKDPARVGSDHANELKKLLNIEGQSSRPFDAAILSGDFTFGCSPDGFMAAEAFIESLSEIVNPEGIIVIPGNHDIDLQKPVCIRRLSLPTDRESAERPFRSFLESVKRHVGPPNDFLSTVVHIHNTKGPSLNIIGLNSCRVERWDAQGWGYVGADQIRNAGNELLKAASDRDIVIAVVHHNPLPIWDVGVHSMASIPAARKFSFTLDAGSVLGALADLGVSLVLHGHTHVESIKRVEGYGSSIRAENPMLILGCGSLGLVGDERDPPHHFQVLELNDNLGVHWKDWNSFHLSIRNAERRWHQSGRLKYGTIHETWNAKSAETVLRQLAHSAHGVEWMFSNVQSWSQLRTYKLEPARWPNVLSLIYNDIRELLPDVKLDELERTIEGIFRRPPSPEDLTQRSLQGYLAYAHSGKWLRKAHAK